MKSYSCKSQSLGDYFRKKAVEKKHLPASPEVQSFMAIEREKEENHL